MRHKIVLEFDDTEDLETFIKDASAQMGLLSRVRPPDQLKAVSLKWKRGKRPRFTDWEAQVIRDNWGIKGVRAIAAMLGRTPTSIHQFVFKARKAGAAFAVMRKHNKAVIEE